MKMGEIVHLLANYPYLPKPLFIFQPMPSDYQVATQYNCGKILHCGQFPPLKSCFFPYFSQAIAQLGTEVNR